MRNDTVLVDTSFLIALYNEKDAAHALVQLAAQLVDDEFLVPQVVLTEAVYLIKRDLGAQGAVKFQNRLIASRLPLQDVTYEDIKRAKDIMEHYKEAKFDFVDCCIMALAERLTITIIGTLDVRDFSFYIPKHAPHFDLLP